jgi:hypothetical protein
MTSSSQPAALGRYLAQHGFAPSPADPAWLDLDAGHQVIRVVHQPGETTFLYCLDPRQGCLYEARFSPGTPGRRDHRRDRRRTPPAPATGRQRTRREA